MLGLVALVAIWFWVPLLLGWASDEDPLAAAATVPADGSAAEVTSPAVKALESTDSEPEEVEHPWEDVAKWLDADPRARPAERPQHRPEPFCPVGPAPEEIVQQKPDAAELAEREKTPEELGLELSSTIIGLRRRVAVISGKAYRQGQSIRLVKDGSQITFKLVEVHDRQIALEREGRRFDLLLSEPQSSGSIQVSRLKD